MLIARWIISLLLVAGIVCFALSIATGDRRFRVIGVRIVRWVVVAGLAFFGVLILERLAVVL